MDGNALLTRTTSLDEFCRAGDIELSSLPANVDSSVGLSPDDVLLAAGSVVEGLGNSKSDLDLLLLTSRPEHLLPPRDEIALLVGRCVIDVRILRLPQVEALLARLREWRRLPWDVMHAAGFAIEERVLLQRLLHGHTIPFSGSKEAPRPAAEDLTLLKLHVARHISRTIQVDLSGYLESDHYGSLVFAAQELLGHATDALVAAYGLSNPHPKWRMRLLDAVPADWETSIVLRPGGMAAAERIWDLHRGPEHLERDECIEHALRVSSFARATFAWAERRLQMQPPVTEPNAWPYPNERGADTVLPHLDFDVDFLLSGEEVVVGRLNDFGETLSLSAAEFDVALLCDGTTTAREADAVIFGGTGGGAGLSIAEDVISRLLAAGLLR